MTLQVANLWGISTAINSVNVTTKINDFNNFIKPYLITSCIYIDITIFSVYMTCFDE